MAGFLIDANLPKRLVFWRADACEFLPDSQWPDHVVWRYARERGLIVVTKDKDFERLAWQDGPPVVILLCAGPASRQVLWHLLERWWPAARDASQQSACRLVKIYPDCIEVLTAADMRRQRG